MDDAAGAGEDAVAEVALYGGAVDHHAAIVDGNAISGAARNEAVVDLDHAASTAARPVDDNAESIPVKCHPVEHDARGARSPRLNEDTAAAAVRGGGTVLADDGVGYVELDQPREGCDSEGSVIGRDPAVINVQGVADLEDDTDTGTEETVDVQASHNGRDVGQVDADSSNSGDMAATVDRDRLGDAEGTKLAGTEAHDRAPGRRHVVRALKSAAGGGRTCAVIGTIARV
jgi:hypothetical protein